MNKIFLTTLLLFLTFSFVKKAHALTGKTQESGVSSSLLIIEDSTPATPDFCSAIALNPHMLLTQGHCVSQPENVQAIIDDHQGNKNSYAVDQIFFHPSFHVDTIGFHENQIDLALLFLQHPLPPSVKPAPWSKKANFENGQRLRLMGFGVSREGAISTGKTLRQGFAFIRPPLSEEILLLENKNAQNSSACSGDSGGAVFSETDYLLLGIIDWKSGKGIFKCGTLTQFISIAAQKEWIESTLSLLFSSPTP